jgi:hypothetical protein
VYDYLSRGMSRRLRLSLVLAAVAAVVVVVAVLAGSALSGSGPGSDPARAVPPNAAAYAWADVHPGGDSGASVRHVLGHVVGDSEHPGPMLASLADRTLARFGVSYSRDIAPWVGGRIGVFVTRFGAGFQGAIVAAVADEDRARQALARTGKPYAVTRGIAIVGTAGAVSAARRAADGSSLGTSDRYTLALAQRESPVAVLYVDLAHLNDALPPSFLGARQRADLRLRFARIEDKPIVLSVTGADNRIAVDSGAPPAPPDPSAPPPVGGGERGTALLPTRLIYSLPAQSWLAVDIPELGQRLFEALSPTVNPGLPHDQLEAAQRRFARVTGLRPVEDVVRWMGGTALFAYGPTPARLTAGLVVESLAPAATRRALAKLRRFLERRPGVRVTPAPPSAGGEGFTVRLAGGAAAGPFSSRLPGPISIVLRGNRVAVVYGPGGAPAALDAPVKLRSVPAFRDAAAQLGGTLLPVGWLVPGPAARFAAAAGLIRSPLFRAALPYLERVAYVELGIKRVKRRALIGAR